MLVEHLRILFQAAPFSDSTDGRAAVNGTAALIAAFAGRQPMAKTRLPNQVYDDIAEYYPTVYQANLHKLDLGPDFIARQLGISRAKLYRVFEPTDGVSHYILQRRLTLAHRLITKSGQCSSSHWRDRCSVRLRQHLGVQSIFPAVIRHVSHRIAPRY